MSLTSSVDSGFCIIRLNTSNARGELVPVGAVAWDSKRAWYNMRLLNADERAEGITARSRAVLVLAKQQLDKWAKQERVPYASDELKPWTAEFWGAVRRVTTASLRFDPPKAMEPMESLAEFELLFEALVRPDVRLHMRRTRVEGAVTIALGSLSSRIKPKLPLPAFGGVLEPVLRGARGQKGTLVVEAVNLASKQARRDADALVSKIQRLRSVPAAGDDLVRVIVGYLTSPGGLNGETDMRNWIAHSTTEDVYDLTRQADVFRGAALRALTDIDAQGSVFK